MPVPVWGIILAVLAGLLLLAVLVFVMHRVSNGRRKRGREEEARKKGKGGQERRRNGKEGREGGKGSLVMTMHDEHYILFGGRHFLGDNIVRVFLIFFADKAIMLVFL